MTNATTDGRHFLVNAPKVACQVLDGEALLIHFEHGHYYSGAGSAAFLLQLVERGASEGELCSALERRFGVDAERARGAVSTFIEQLLHEELFVVGEAGRAESHAPALPDIAPVADAGAFEEPRLSKFTDLEDLLVLDPVHDVMMTGWLNSAASAS